MMGKGILIIVFGVSTIVMGIILSLINNTIQGTEASVNFFERTHARIIANSAVEIYLEKMRRDKTLHGNFTNNSLLGGTYDINIFGPDTALTIRSTSRFRGITHISLAKAKRSLVQIPDITASISITSNTLNTDLGGNLTINGHDHNIDGSAGPGASIPGITVSSSEDSAYVVNDLKTKITNNIVGAGGTPSVATTPQTTNWKEVAENYIFAADITLSTGQAIPATMGTAGDPKITYVSGDVNFNSQSGYGILVVNGNLRMNGNFKFHGLIIAYGESTIESTVNGNGGIYGAIVFAGQSVNLKATGTASFYYSSQAINLAKNNLKSSRFEILDWWE